MPHTVLVVPCYDEERRLQFDRFRDFVARSNAVRLLFVDDGSRDNTAAVIQRFCEAWSDRAALLKLPRNCGKAEAVRRGVLAGIDSGASFVGFWDADLATPLEAADLLLAEFAEHPAVDLVMGSRVLLLGRTIERSPVRHYAGRSFATVVSLLLDLEVYDTQCGAKLFRSTPSLQRVFARPFLSRWIFDVEVLARLAIDHAHGGELPLTRCVREFPLPVWRDVAGSKIKPTDLVTVSRDLCRISWWLYEERRRLRSERSVREPGVVTRPSSHH